MVVLEKGDQGNWDTAPTLLEPLPDGKIVAMSANGVLTRLFGGQREGHGAINIDAARDVREDEVQISIEVTRTGGSAGAVSVEYSSSISDVYAEPAIEGKDFTAVNGRLDWADGDTSPREIVVPILEDTLKEDYEQFAVEVRSPSGGAVILNTRAIVAINDDGDTLTSTGGGGGGGGGGVEVVVSPSSLIATIALVFKITAPPDGDRTSTANCS